MDGTDPSGPTATPEPGLDATQPSIDPDAQPARSTLPTVDPSAYRRVADLAKGGMGRIVKARDRRLGRTVAIKETLGDSAATRARFEREIRLTARLEHPSIVALHEAGRWPSGEQFFAMRLVPGRSLDAVIAERTTLPERLALLPHVIAAADALAYAHGERVIHRDLKPANILVGDFGETVVIDWGLAKDLRSRDADPASDSPYRKGASGLETVDGSVMGTPAYMPPEQAAGDKVDERSDVYALGAILYTVLTGAAPYTGKSLDEVLVRVISGPPTPIAKRAPGVPIDLVTIVDKAMASEPKDRYPTARELVADLKRFQTGQLVGAHRYSSRELFARWLNKHRLTVAIAAALVVLLAVIGVVSWRRDVHARAVADRHRAVAITRRDAAEKLVDYMVFQLRDRLKQVGRLDVLGTTAERVLGYYAQLGALGAQDASAEGRRAATLTVLGEVASARGQLDEARARYTESLAIHRRQRELHPDDSVRNRNVGVLLDELGLLESSAGRIDEALALLREALALREEIARRFPEHPDVKNDLAWAHDHLGTVLLEDRQAIDDARPHLERALQLQLELLDARPDDPGQMTDTARARENLGDLAMYAWDLARALAYYESALELRRRALAKRPDDQELRAYVAGALDRTAEALLRHERRTEATAARTEAQEIRLALLAAEPDHADNQRDLGVGWVALGDAASARDDVDGALALYAKAIAVFDALLVRDPDNILWLSDLSIPYQNTGNLRLLRGELDAAEVAFRRNLELGIRAHELEPDGARRVWAVGVSHERFGDLAGARGDLAGAAAAYRTEVEWLRRAAAMATQDPQYRSDLAWTIANAAAAELKAGERDQALAHLREALAIREALAKAHPDREDWANDAADSRAQLAAAEAKP